MYSCSQIAAIKLWKKTGKNRVTCKGLAVEKDDPKLKHVEGECHGKVVAVAYDDDEVGESSGSVLDKLNKGLLLKWTAYNCTSCLKTGGECGFDEANMQFNCYCPDRTYALACFKKKQKSGLIIGSEQKSGLIIVSAGLSLIAVVLIALVIIYRERRQKLKKLTALWPRGNKMNQNVEVFLKNYGSLAPKRYTYAEIRKMTSNFKEKLGEGGYSAVYKGKLHDSRSVAVKKLKILKGDGEDFINEVVSISRSNHVNIVNLLGFCFEGKKRALVYEFLSKGSLEKFMYSAASGQSLALETLFSISVGIAKGLDYLHRGCNMQIIHFDIKPHNILLDEELHPKISDFGLARLCPPKNSMISMSEARGTIGYIAPEVFCRNFGGVSHKSDVYSYGMLLLDLVCGRKNVVAEAQHSSQLYFPEWIYRQLEFEEDTEAHNITYDDQKKLLRKMILVGLWCIQSYPSNRPPMSRVLEMLEGSLESLQVPPKPHLSSPANSVFNSNGTLVFTGTGHSVPSIQSNL